MIVGKKLLFTFFLIALLMLSACNELSKEELTRKVIEANADLDSYALKMDVVMDVELESALEEVQEMTTTMVSEGKILRSEKKLYLKTSMSTGVEGASMGFETETYFFDDVAYIKSMGMWLKQTLEEDIWKEQDQVLQMTELLEKGEVEVLPEEDGYYILKITPDMDSLKSLLESQQQTSLIDGVTDYSDIVESYSTTVWINKKTFVIMKSSSEVVMVLNPKNTQIQSGNDFIEMKTSSKIDVEISDIGKDFTFELPKEAEDAIDMDKMVVPSANQQGVVA
jgi:hypothetical protein